jgi:UDP-N-acetyl-D-mannosaminuronic acid dehydrogenase
MISRKRVLVCGLGYIGLPTSIIISKTNKYDVIGFDINKNLIEKLRQGFTQFFEPNFDELFKQFYKKLLFTNKPLNADIYIITVPTPFKSKEKKIPQPDISFVFNVCKQIASLLKNNDLIIIESTCPVGTTDKVNHFFKKNRPDLKHLHISYCPERVLPGNIVNEIIFNNRAIGGINNKSSIIAGKFYSEFVKGDISLTDCKTAEMVKLAENSYRDVNIAFANEISMIANQNGINPYELIELANKHPRVNILNPGPGVGGHCIAVDPWFIVSKDPSLARLINVSRNVNDNKIKWCIKKINEKIKTINKKNINVFLLGLSYKPNIDDIRESPSIKIVNYFEKKVKLVLVDPLIKQYQSISIENSLENIDKADLIVILVKHDYFVKNIKKLLKNKSKIIDFVGLVK